MPDPSGQISHLPEFHRGFSWKPAVRCATTANVTISTALNAGDTIDGVTLAAGDRVLVKNQGTASQNGIYIAGVTPVRAPDMDQDTTTTTVPAEEIAGSLVFVAEGTANTLTLWYTTTAFGGTIGSTSITWTQVTLSGLADPMTTRGDIIIRNASNVTARLGKGAAGTILTSDGTDVAWGNGPMTTQDDIIVGGSSGVPTRLAKGSDSQVLTVDPTTHHLLWATPSSGFSNPMTTKGDIIVGDTGGSPIRKAVGSDAQVLTADSASTGGIKWAAAGGGGGLTQAFVGYNTAGGSWETWTANRVFCKQITPANDCLITSIDAYVRPSTDNVLNYSVMLLTDVTGAPEVMIAATSQHTVYFSNSSSMPGGARWFATPLGMWITAGTYWIAVMASAGYIDLAYDGSGSDQYFTDTGTYTATGHYSTWTITTGSRKYSVRANTIR